MVKHVGIIGTAGRDKDRIYDDNLWNAMCYDVSKLVVSDGVTLVSGGAAWADHLAVWLFLENYSKFHLKLFLPAPYDHEGFIGCHGSAGSAANYYHNKFSTALGKDTFHDIVLAERLGAEIEFEKSTNGLGGMFSRNKKVANACKDGVIAYTWGEDSVADGGTKNTWDMCSGRKVHRSLTQVVRSFDKRTSDVPNVRHLSINDEEM